MSSWNAFLQVQPPPKVRFLLETSIKMPASFDMVTENRFKRKKGHVLIVAASTFWLVILIAGMAFFMSYENRSGLAAEAPNNWPTASRIRRATDRATLIVLAHPHCPCTRATINELARLMARHKDRLDAYVIFVKPEGVEERWEQSDTWASAAQIPGVEVVRDDQGRESKLFDAHTSGQSMLYDQNGKLLFGGGITVGRGAEGDSMGAAAIASLVTGEAEPVRATSVFGCPLFANDPYCQVKKEIPNAASAR